MAGVPPSARAAFSKIRWSCNAMHGCQKKMAGVLMAGAPPSAVGPPQFACGFMHHITTPTNLEKESPSGWWEPCRLLLAEDGRSALPPRMEDGCSAPFLRMGGVQDMASAPKRNAVPKTTVYIKTCRIHFCCGSNRRLPFCKYCLQHFCSGPMWHVCVIGRHASPSKKTRVFTPRPRQARICNLPG